MPVVFFFFSLSLFFSFSPCRVACGWLHWQTFFLLLLMIKKKNHFLSKGLRSFAPESWLASTSPRPTQRTVQQLAYAPRPGYYFCIYSVYHPLRTLFLLFFFCFRAVVQQVEFYGILEWWRRLIQKKIVFLKFLFHSFSFLHLIFFFILACFYTLVEGRFLSDAGSDHIY